MLAEDLELAQTVSMPRRTAAIEHCLAPAVTLPRGKWDARASVMTPGGIGLLVLSGLLIRRVGIGDRFGAELLGQGDLLRPWQDMDTQSNISRTTGWLILERTRMALLDEEAANRLAKYPELIGILVGKALARSRSLTNSLAIAQYRRVNLRVCMVLWHLAERWGRPCQGGVLVPLRLTHSTLAELVCARRPSVSMAVSELRRKRLIDQLREGWFLRGEPPTPFARA